jgi:hypothetical protein
VTHPALPSRAARHWLIALALVAGLVLRVLAQVAYRPALMYIDTEKYLYNGYPGADPVGYKAPLRLLLAAGNLSLVTAVQHLLGLAMGLVIYLVLVRLGCWRWLAAIGAIPVLLDAYQLQIEQTVMPDVWFEALIVAAIAVLLLAPGRKIGLRHVIAAGLLLGASATVRQVGEILLLPALLYIVIAGGGWRAITTRSAALVAAFAVPVIGYMAGSYFVSGHFWLDSGSLSISTYGRMATAADCTALRIPPYERGLCPTARQRAHGIDWLDHDAHSPIKAYAAPKGLNRYAVIAKFDHQVAEQQPGRVASAIIKDGIKLFAITRTSSQSGTPISRWQFQDTYPVYPGWVTLDGKGDIVFWLRLTPAGGPPVRHVLDAGYGGKAQVTKPIADFLRAYQLGGGYTPGPALALLTLAALAGSVLALIRRLPDQPKRLALGCLLFFGCAVAVLAMSDAFQFSWRYQLPALITLPPAGVAGIAAFACVLQGRHRATPVTRQDGKPEVAAPVA